MSITDKIIIALFLGVALGGSISALLLHQHYINITKCHKDELCTNL